MYFFLLLELRNNLFIDKFNPYLLHGVTYMNLELIGQLVSVALIVGAGPIIIGALFVRGGNL